MRQQMQDARREHEEVRRHLEHLTAGNMPEDEWARHLQMMKQGIEHHVQEEESKILPAAQRIVGDQRLRELGAEFKRMEEQDQIGRPSARECLQQRRRGGSRRPAPSASSFYEGGAGTGITMCARR